MLLLNNSLWRYTFLHLEKSQELIKLSLNHVGGVSLISEEEPGGHLVSPPPVQGPGPVPQLVEVFLAWPGDEEVQVSEEQGVTQQQTHGGGVVAPRRK